MPVGLYTGPNVSIADGVATVFAYDFKILDEDHLLVTVDGLEVANYTVDGVGDEGGGSITFSAPPANGAEVVRERNVPYERDTDYQRNGPWREDTVDRDFDLQEMQIQQIAAAVKQAFKAPRSVAVDQVLSDADWEGRASKFLGFSALGAFGVFSLQTTELLVSAYIETLLDAVDAAAARAVLGFPLDEPLRGALGGCTLSNNSGDATNDIDIAVGECRDSTNTVNITIAAMTKRLDAGWAAGTNQGFRNSAVAIANTTYHVYAVSKADGTQDFYAHTSATVATVLAALQAEAGGSAYVYARRIGSILREAGAIVGFTQKGDHFYRKAPIPEGTTINPGTSRVIQLIKVPVGVKLLAKITFILVDTGVTLDNYAIVNSPDHPDTAPTTNNWNVVVYAGPAYIASTFTREVLTDASAQIAYRLSQSAASVFVALASEGWIDARGKDD